MMTGGRGGRDVGEDEERWERRKRGGRGGGAVGEEEERFTCRREGDLVLTS